MIPDIIFNKIYWYLWRYKQLHLCREYKNSLWNIGDSIDMGFPIFMRLNIVYKNKIVEKIYEYNYRINNSSDYIYIYGKYGQRNHKIHKNYIV